MAINTIAAVISRFVFNDAFIVTDELNMIFIIIVTFAGISYAARNGRHIRMSAIYDLLKIKSRKILMIIIVSITSICMFFLSYYSLVYIFDIYESGRILPALGIPVFYIYVWVPIGFFITALQYAFTIVKNIQENLKKPFVQFYLEMLKMVFYAQYFRQLLVLFDYYLI